jgi:hypothetical protein
MLNWTVAMRRLFFSILILILIGIPGFGVAAQSGDPPGVQISAPPPDTPLKGLVSIEGSTLIDSFQSWELAFGYAADTTGTWFLIAEGDAAISGGELAQWDTTTISDGDYNLRLSVFLEGGRREHYVVENLRVRNYSPIETITPTPSLTPTPYTETPLPSQTPTTTQQPTETPLPDTPTPLPTNPVTITQGNINNSLMRGAAGAAAAFVLVGVYLSIKRILRK